MRADRLLALVLLLRSRGRMSASALAAELEVSTRTVLRDVEALSTAGIPVYAERGRDGGFALLPGFTTDLTGLTPDEAVALLTASSRADVDPLGMAPALASAMRKVLAAMPDARRATATAAAGRVAVRRGGWLRDPPSDGPLDVVRHAVFSGRRLRIRYAARDEAAPMGAPLRPASWRTIDPIGLVQAAGRWYLLATHNGADRTYRASRIREAVKLDEPAERATGIDLEQLFEQRRAAFVATLQPYPVSARVRVQRRDAVVRTSVAVSDEHPDGDGWLRLELAYGDREHAAAMLWAAGADVEVLAPADLRESIAQRAADLVARYAGA